MPGHSRPKDGVATLAYDPGIHEAVQRRIALRLSRVDARHGLPGQARQRRGEVAKRRAPVRSALFLVAVMVVMIAVAMMVIMPMRAMAVMVVAIAMMMLR